MSEPDLRGMFRHHRGNVALTAQTVFSNRESERTAFFDAIDQHGDWHRGAWARSFVANEGDDLSIGRENVLSFYGVGGIGKSTLSRKLEDLLAERSSQTGVDSVAFRWDLGQAGALDWESFVLGLRSAVGASGRSPLAFDLLLARYWSLVHPGESVDQYVARNSILRRASKTLSLSSHMTSAIGDIGAAVASTSAVFEAGTEAARATLSALRSSRLAAQARQECRYFEPLMNGEPDGDLLAYMAATLSYDLRRFDSKRRLDVVGFVDTYEEATRSGNREFERWFQRLVFLTPNVLWVITGRNRLDWDDSAIEGQLDYVGSDCWPCLAPRDDREPRQHLVGYLTRHDALDYLANRVTLGTAPAIEPELQETIAEAAQGLPLHLDLAVMRYLKVAGPDGKVAPSEFTLTFGALVERIMRDLPTVERALLEAACLLDHFDADLVRAAAGESVVGDAAVERFLQRPFIVASESSRWPYRIHDAVRACLEEQSGTGSARWSGRERRAAAARALDCIGEQVAPAVIERNRPEIVSGLTLGLELACRHHLGVGWLRDAAFALHESSSWQAVLPEHFARAEISDDASALAAGLAMISRRRMVDRQWIVDGLDEVLATARFDDDLTDLFVRYRSHSLRRLGRFDEALDGYVTIHERRGRLSPEAEWNIVRHLEATGRFEEATEARGDAKHRRAGLERVLGNVYRDNALFVEAEAFYARAAERALADGELGRRSHCLSDLALARAWRGAASLDDDVRRALEAAEGTGRRQPAQQALLARALGAVGGAGDVLVRLVEEYRQLSSRAGMTENEIFAAVVLALHAAVTDDRPGLTDARAQVVRRSEELGWFGFWAVIVAWWCGEQPTTPVQWLGGPEAARRRWEAVVADRQGDT